MLYPLKVGSQYDAMLAYVALHTSTTQSKHGKFRNLRQKMQRFSVAQLKLDLPVDSTHKSENMEDKCFRVRCAILIVMALRRRRERREKYGKTWVCSIFTW